MFSHVILFLHFKDKTLAYNREISTIFVARLKEESF